MAAATMDTTMAYSTKLCPIFETMFKPLRACFLCVTGEPLPAFCNLKQKTEWAYMAALHGLRKYLYLKVLRGKISTLGRELDKDQLLISRV